MSVAARPCVIGGSALIASALIAVTPVVAPPDLHRVSNTAVRLVDAVGDLGLGSLSGLFSDLGSSSSGLLGDLEGLLNIPYNIFADIVDIPYTESLALEEYAYALGPAGSVGGVAGWIPPGATTADGGVDVINGQDYYALGGTGSWWMESMGNTWGWDNGNWPQVDALIHFVLPLQWTEGLTTSLQSLAQSSLIDGSSVNCEFECSNIVGYLGGWLSHLDNVLSSTYPVTQTDTVGANVGDVVNLGPTGTETTAIWSGQPVTINPLLETFEAVWQNAVESPSANPIMLPNIGDVFDSVVKLVQGLVNDFDPLITGSFAYWGADTLYSIPSLIGGLVHDVSLGLIPNEFTLLNNGAEPVSGYTDGPGHLLPGLADGVKYLVDGLLAYVGLDPSTAAASASDASTAAAASADASTLFGSVGDQGGLLADLSSVMPSLGTDLATTFPQLSADLSSWFPDLAAALIP